MLTAEVPGKWRDVARGLWGLVTGLAGAVHCVLAAAALQGVDALAGRSHPGNLARPRRFELAAAINRLRSAQLRQLA